MRFFVNVDHVATVRQARLTDEPDPREAALLCESGGADGITVHLREDRRHIQPADVNAIAAAIKGTLNLELAANPEVVDFAVDLQPHQATLVPEKREEVTTEGGIDLFSENSRLLDAIERLGAVSVRVSLFIDPVLRVIDRARELGVPAIELHTGEYANHFSETGEHLNRLVEAAAHARQIGLAVHAGHGLTYRNVGPVAAIAEIEELNIGHSIVSRSILVGIEAAVRQMKDLITGAR
jgi:pyridoxine 5-phosphate synthase